MKIGFKSRLWGSKISNLPKALDLIAEAGYQGVEFSQRPEELGFNNFYELWKLLSERQLELLSLTCGSLGERLEFLKEYKPVYLSIRHHDLNLLQELVTSGYTPALHPGVFCRTRRISDALELAKEYPDLKFICDTAHITIAGENPVEAVNTLTDKIVAIHLKDWKPDYGRSGPRYARGFTDLGKGFVKLDDTLTQLNKINFKGWVVAEIENSYQDELKAFNLATKWFVEKGLLSNNPIKDPVKVKFNHPQRSPVHVNSDKDARFREAIFDATAHDPDMFYQLVAKAIEELTNCDLVIFWAVSPSQEQMALFLSSIPRINSNESKLVKPINETPNRLSIARQAPVTRFNINYDNNEVRDAFSLNSEEFTEMTYGTPYRQMISLPIYNTDHKNYIRMIINIFPHSNFVDLSDDNLSSCGNIITMASDIVLDKLCSVAATRVNHIASQSNDIKVFLKNLKKLIKESLRCDGVAVFLVNESGDRLELRESTGTKWMAAPEEEFYTKGEGLTGQTWERNEINITVNSMFETGHKGKSEEIVENSELHACLWVPFVNTNGSVLGVIRCRNKIKQSDQMSPNMFTDEDASIADAIGQALVPHLKVLLDKERRANALKRLSHELRQPLASIRSAASMMLHTKGVDKFFDHDYPGDIMSWSELMRRLLGNADLYSYAPSEFPIQPTPTYLMADIVAPAVKQVRGLLQEREFNFHNIHYGNFEEVPKLWLDRNQFQQVIFNLLSNAIKHCYNDPSAFQVEINGFKVGGEYVIQMRDWGPGIPYEMKDSIFEEGVRTPEAVKTGVVGQGLGLWIVHEIIIRHGGSIKLTSLQHPTEFSIFLPDRLSRRLRI